MIVALVAAPVIAAADAGGGLPEWVTILISVIIAVGGGGGLYQLLNLRSTKRNVGASTDKSRAEAADIISDTAMSLLAPMREQLAESQRTIERLTARCAELEASVATERDVSQTRIRQLEQDIRERDRHIRSQGAEILQLRRSAPGWPGGAAES